jgi:hypothetical protein
MMQLDFDSPSEIGTVITDFDRSKSLQQLEDSDWGEPTYDSHLVTTVHQLRRKPLNEFSVEDLRIMIGQGIGLPFLVPLAVEQLEQNPLAGSDLFEGDLLYAVLRVSESYWAGHPAFSQRMGNVLACIKNILPALGESDQRVLQSVLQRVAPIFQHQ